MSTVALYILIFLSGCCGLIYEVVWHRYLAILLGAQARATAIVLAIFLGGIAAGYAAFGRWSRWKAWNLLRTYAFVELGLGLWALLFPVLFQIALPLTSKLYFYLGVNNLLIDIFISTLLIGLPTFLMGGTLPLLTQGLSEELTQASQTHARIYGVNTLGAGIGCLVAGYYLIPSYGLRPSVSIGALINIFIAGVVFFYFAKFKSKTQKPDSLRPSAKIERLTPTQIALFAVAFLSGFYLLTLQTVLMRLMGLSTGSSNYTFTLIVSLFVMGLGFGSLRIYRIAKFNFNHLFWNQLILAASLLGVYFSVSQWSYWVHLVRVNFRDLPEAFYLYQAMLGVLFAALLIVPLAMAGVTLPLCFHLLKDRKESLGHRVGQLYGLNSVGCVLGALFGGYLFFNFLNLDHLFKVCLGLILVTVAIAYYLKSLQKKPETWERAFSVTVLAALAVVTVFAPLFPRDRYTQPFRHPTPIADVTFKGAEAFGKFLARSTKYLLFKDGPNTSVGIGVSHYENSEVSRTIFVNGKSDGNTRGDFFTTVMLAHIPGLLAKKMEEICVVGFGTGTTVGTLAQYPDVKRIDVAEISGTIIENASYFDSYNGGVSKNERVHFNEMDAFRFFEGSDKTFDLIVSEPSNPWVTGIENLFSQEFYGLAKRKLNPGGMFVQWLHSYSFNDHLFRMVLSTMGSEFPHVSVFQLKGGDYALVATTEAIDRGDLRRAARRYDNFPNVRKALAEAGITRFETVLSLELIPPTLSPPLASGAGTHHLESPKLSNEAALAFFVGSAAQVDALRRGYVGYYSAINDTLLADYLNGQMPSLSLLGEFRSTFCDNVTSKVGILCNETLAAIKMLNPSFQPDKIYENVPTERDLASLESLGAPAKKKFTQQDLQQVSAMYETYRKFASPIAHYPVSGIIGHIDACLNSVPRSDELFGECLLQKILMLENLLLPGAEFKANVAMYLEWFEKLPANSKNYGKLKEARDLLVRMVEMQRG